jgi:hypothetical protein
VQSGVELLVRIERGGSGGSAWKTAMRENKVMKDRIVEEVRRIREEHALVASNTISMPSTAI